MPRLAPLAVPRHLGAVALALASLFAMSAPPPAAAHDIGAVIEAMRLGRYPLHEP